MPVDDIPTVKPAWLDRDQPWWAKWRRAGVHLQSLERAISDLQGADAWHVESHRDGARPEDLAYHFRVNGPFPSDLVTIIGDVIHNLRSALESVVYALVVETVGSENLTEAQERAATYPICRDLDAFNRWLDRRVVKGQPQKVRDLFSEAQILGMQSIQPFAFALQLSRFNLSRSTTPQQDLESDAAHRLNLLWNLDKHRTLIRLAWHLDFMYWAHDGVGWAPLVPDGSLLADGQLLGHFVFPDATQVTDPGVRFEISPALADDSFPWHGSVHQVLSAWHQFIDAWMVPCLFMTIEAGHPPLIIPNLRAHYL